MKKFTGLLASVLCALTMSAMAQDQADFDNSVVRNSKPKIKVKKDVIENGTNSKGTDNSVQVLIPIDGQTGITMLHSIKKIGSTYYTKRWSYEAGGGIISSSTIDTGAMASSGQIKQYVTDKYLGWFTVRNDTKGTISYHYNNNVKSPDSVIVGCYSLFDITSSVKALNYATVGNVVDGFSIGKNGTYKYVYYNAKSTSPYNFNNLMVPLLQNAIAVDEDEFGHPYAVTSNGNIYKLNKNDFTAVWVKIFTGSKTLRAVDVAAGSGKVFFCGLNSVDGTNILYELKNDGSYVVQKTAANETIYAKRVDVTAFQWSEGFGDVWFVSAKTGEEDRLCLFDEQFTYIMDDVATGVTTDVGAIADKLIK